MESKLMAITPNSGQKMNSLVTGYTQPNKENTAHYGKFAWFSNLWDNLTAGLAALYDTLSRKFSNARGRSHGAQTSLVTRDVIRSRESGLLKKQVENITQVKNNNSGSRSEQKIFLISDENTETEFKNIQSTEQKLKSADLAAAMKNIELTNAKNTTKKKDDEQKKEQKPKIELSLNEEKLKNIIERANKSKHEMYILEKKYRVLSREYAAAKNEDESTNILKDDVTEKLSEYQLKKEEYESLRTNINSLKKLIFSIKHPSCSN
jgi:hypothetical protein